MMSESDLQTFEEMSKSYRILGQPLETYFAQVRDRLHTGAKEYGDKSFARPVPVTVDEILQELADVSGWSFIAWVRINEMKHLWDDPEMNALAKRREFIVENRAKVGAHSDMKRVAILAEELGEVSRAVLKEEPGRVYEELMDVAAFAMEWAAHLRQEAEADSPSELHRNGEI